MPLTLTIRNVPALDNGSPIALVLDQRGAVIGRAATSDWCLPDPARQISSRHCEVRFADGRYELIDASTNGTFLYGQGARLAGPHTIGQGDVFLIGSFEIAAALDDAAASAAAARNAEPVVPEWQGWDAAGGGGSAPAPAANASAWGAPAPSSAISGGGPMSQSWAAPTTDGSGAGGAMGGSQALGGGWGVAPAAPEPAPAPRPASSDWGASAKGASDWSSPATPPPPPGGNDIWGSFEQSNVVDWARGGFGSPAPAPAPANFAAPAADFAGPGAAPAPAPAAGGWGAPAAPAPAPAEAKTAQPPAPTPAAPTPAGGGGAGFAALLAAAGVDPAGIKQGEAEAATAAGNLLRRLVAGLVVMLEARARAKSQMGAQGTALEFDGNNPLKFARSPEQALLQLLNPPMRGFMTSDRAIEDAYKDLQAHQMATLRAMQGALRATLDRFSPTAIRARATDRGLLGKILPGARDAALWAAYEREFSGVAQGSDEAFMDMFSKEFRRAYEEIAGRR